MEFLTIVYQRDDDMHWHALVEQYPELKVVHKTNQLEAQEAILLLVCNEFFYRHKSLSSWCIGTEVIKYHNFEE